MRADLITDEESIWMDLPPDVVKEFIRRMTENDQLPDHIILREMARDGVL